MELVKQEDLPKKEDIMDVPLDDPMKIFKVCQELEQVCEREKGVGISAVQVGIPWKLFIVKSDGTCPFIEEGKYGYFANVEYKPVGDEQVVSLEGCLTIRSDDGQLRLFQVNRYKKVQITGQRLHFDKLLKFDNFYIELSTAEEGIVFQHEADHSSAVLISEIGKEVFVWKQ